MSKLHLVTAIDVRAKPLRDPSTRDEFLTVLLRTECLEYDEESGETTILGATEQIFLKDAAEDLANRLRKAIREIGEYENRGPTN